MSKELRIYLLAVVLPTIAFTVVGIRLVQVEWRHSRHAFVQSGIYGVSCSRGPTFDDVADQPIGKTSGERLLGLHSVPGGVPPPPYLARIFDPEHDTAELRMLLMGVFLVLILTLMLSTGGLLLLMKVRRIRADARRKTDFIGNAAHAFKTPLTTICLCTELLNDESLDAARRLRALRALTEATDNLKRIVTVGMDLCGFDRGGPTPQDAGSTSEQRISR